jgi:hypothetical protein
MKNDMDYRCFRGSAVAMELKGTWLTFDKKAHNCIKDEGISNLLTESLPENWANIF